MNTLAPNTRSQCSTWFNILHLFGKIGLRLFGLMLLWSLSVPAFSQHHLLSSGSGMGAYAGPVLKLSTVDGRSSLFFGGRAGMSIALDSTNSLSIGGGMYGLVTGLQAPTPVPGADIRYLQFGYGGMELEYGFRPADLLHVSVSTLLGFGRAGYNDDEYAYSGFGSGHMWGGGPAFFVAEPGANLLLNVTSFLRLGLGASYRFTGATATGNLQSLDLSGPAGMVSLQLGRYF